MAPQKAMKKKSADYDSAANPSHEPTREPAREFGRTTNDDPQRHEQIAKRAYELWRHRGGDPVENWLAAEAELSSRTPAAAPHKMPNE